MNGPELTSSIFMGEITASVSHDIQNVLAIIRESSGLIEDILKINQDNANLQEFETLSSSISSIIKQVDRGVLITSNLNKFAHTTELVETTNISEIFETLSTLTKRIFVHKGLDVKIEITNDSILIPIEPILFQALIYKSIQHSGLFSSEGQIMIISDNKTIADIKINRNSEAAHSLSSKENSWLRLSSIANAANATITISESQQVLQIEL